MKIRLEGTKAEIDWAVESLKQHYSLVEVSKLYPNRDRITYRCYAELVPALSNQPKADDAVLGNRTLASE